MAETIDLCTASDEGAPEPAVSAALFDRFESLSKGEYANPLLTGMRRQLGGHNEKLKE